MLTLSHMQENKIGLYCNTSNLNLRNTKINCMPKYKESHRRPYSSTATNQSDIWGKKNTPALETDKMC